MNNKKTVIILQIITLIFISFANIDIILKIFLSIGYIMLFIQKKWHKHIPIMTLMTAILFLSSIYIK